MWTDATHYAVCAANSAGAGANMLYGDYPLGGFVWRVSGLAFQVGVAHSYAWACDGVAGQVNFYKDGVVDPAGPLIYTPIAPTNLALSCGAHVVLNAMNAAFCRAAWFEGAIPTLATIKALHAWGGRTL
jgi:hypothetical protein